MLTPFIYISLPLLCGYILYPITTLSLLSFQIELSPGQNFRQVNALLLASWAL